MLFRCCLILFISVLRIQLILIRIRILDPHWKKMDPDPDPDPGYFFKIYWIFLTQQNFQTCCLIFFAYFYAKTWWTIQISGNFYNLSFSIVQIWVLRVIFFCSLLIFCPLDPDPDPDPGSENLADPTDPDPDPKHWFI